jgi:glycosyltransferase involved in cell wall biosynthesis
MVIVSGLERMTFEVLRVLRQRHAPVHRIVNSWENHRDRRAREPHRRKLVHRYYRPGFGRQLLNPWLAQFVWDILRTSMDCSASRHFGDAHILVPEYTVALRNLPALILLRLTGVSAIFASRIIRTAAASIAAVAVCSRRSSRLVPTPCSAKSAARERRAGQKDPLIRNAVSHRSISAVTIAMSWSLARRGTTILSVGQLAPFKGTHLVVDAAIRLIAAGRDVQAIIVGAFRMAARPLHDSLCAARAASREGAGRIHFVGARECSDHARQLRAGRAHRAGRDLRQRRAEASASIAGRGVSERWRAELVAATAPDICVRRPRSTGSSRTGFLPQHPDERARASQACREEAVRPAVI